MADVASGAHDAITGHSPFVYWAPFILAGGALLLGIPVYAAQRGKMTEPEAVPEYVR
jgi:APA family basic amino acid/polyamine antiporter